MNELLNRFETGKVTEDNVSSKRQWLEKANGSRENGRLDEVSSGLTWTEGSAADERQTR